MRSTILFSIVLIASFLLASSEARCNNPNVVRPGKPLAIDSFADQNNGVFYFFYYGGANNYYLETCADQDCTRTNAPALALPSITYSQYNLFKAVQFKGGALLTVAVLFVSGTQWNIVAAINGQRVTFGNGQQILPVYGTVQDLSVVSTYGGSAYFAVTGKGNGDGKNFVVIYTVGTNFAVTGPQTQVTPATNNVANVIKGTVNPAGLLASWVWNTDGKDFGLISCSNLACTSAPLRFLQTFPSLLQLKQGWSYNLVSGRPAIYIAQNGAPLVVLYCNSFSCSNGFKVTNTPFFGVPVTSSFTTGGSLQLALNTNPNQVDVFKCNDVACVSNQNTHRIGGLNYAVATWANTARTSSIVLTEGPVSRTLLYNFC